MCLFSKAASHPSTLKNNHWDHHLTSENKKFVYRQKTQIQFHGSNKNIFHIKTNVTSKCVVNVTLTFYFMSRPNKEKRADLIIFRTKYSKSTENNQLIIKFLIRIISWSHLNTKSKNQQCKTLRLSRSFWFSNSLRYKTRKREKLLWVSLEQENVCNSRINGGSDEKPQGWKYKTDKIVNMIFFYYEKD